MDHAPFDEDDRWRPVRLRLPKFLRGPSRAPSLKRRRRAARAAYLGGALLFLTGGTGAFWIVDLGWELVALLSPWLGRLLGPLFVVAWIVAALGGITVAAGGYMLTHRTRRVGKLLIAFGAGSGLLGFALHLGLSLAAGGNPVVDIITTALTLHGLGVLLALYAQATG